MAERITCFVVHYDEYDRSMDLVATAEVSETDEQGMVEVEILELAYVDGEPFNMSELDDKQLELASCMVLDAYTDGLFRLED